MILSRCLNFIVPGTLGTIIAALIEAYWLLHFGCLFPF